MDYEKRNDLEGKVADIMKKKADFNFKERFGCIPKSVMKFNKTKELMELIDYDNSDIGKVDGDAKAKGGGYAKNLRYSIYNPDLAKFLLEYYTKSGDLVFDPFMGRGTRPLISLLLNRFYVGCDISSKTVEWNKDIIKRKFPDKYDNQCIIHNCDGINFSLDTKCDAVFTSPPYYDIEKYGGENEDLSHMTFEEFDLKIDKLFNNLYKYIKWSCYETLEFYPIIMTVGSRRTGKNGILDMDYIFQTIAKKNGFILWDKIITENNTPGAAFTFRRNYCYGFVTKNYETTLIFLKMKK